ncbi:MAG: glycosyltransferase [Lentisphaerae bacterium]|jgi:dolichol-phosphate mannosyltransferase|nr:glycosyltransferase [Lentisphaerota bacterium]
MSRTTKISIVVPFLNEMDNLPTLLERVGAVFANRAEDWELLLVDDGSTDGSPEWAIEQSRSNRHVRVLRLSRNFGHQLAITAGLDRTDGDAVVIMDADLQDTPETIPALINKWREGYEVVFAVRRSRAGETWLKKFLAARFYRLFRFLTQTQIPMDAGDFRLVDRRVVDALREMRELHRFMRGLTCWVGYRQGSVEYDRAARHAGETKYPVWKSARLAIDAITSFSAAPLRWIVQFGMLVCVLALIWVIYVMGLAIFAPHTLERGWASLIAVIVFLGGVQLIGIGMLGQYVSRIFEEGKRRPLYILRDDTRDTAAPPS